MKNYLRRCERAVLIENALYMYSHVYWMIFDSHRAQIIQ